MLSHRQKVKAEIAKDRAERAAREKAKTESGSSSTAAQQPSQSTAQQQPSQSTAPQSKKEYDTCRLQVYTA